MRIVGGIYKGRTLSSPEGDDIRPTSDKARQAIMNMLHSRGWLENAVVLDAFCGTGALGLEALSQGAAQVLFFDNAPKSVRLCQKNIESLGCGDCCDVQTMNAAKPKPKPEFVAPATLVFMDPPYKKGLIDAAIPALLEAGWLADSACIVIETAKGENISCPLILEVHEKIYGDTKITLARLKQEGI